MRPFSQNYQKVLATRKKLPVYQFLDDLLVKVQGNQSVVVEGEVSMHLFHGNLAGSKSRFHVLSFI
jgi:hypothetical protein